jgi:murein peptide amidase A
MLRSVRRARFARAGRRPAIVGLAAVVAAVVAVVAFGDSDARTRPRRPPTGTKRRASDPLIQRRVDLGHSVRGRTIFATVTGDPDNERRTLVVGVIHGDEAAGRRIARDLASGPAPKEALVWAVPVLNPDGVAAGTRQNAHGVDLNRNFPWRWRPLGVRGDQQYSGPRSLSEPESRIARSLILRVRPRVSIWFHQPLGLVDESGGSVAIERRFAQLSGLPLRRLTRYPGSAVSWQDHRLPRTTAFVVELPRGTLSAARARGYDRAVLRLARD